MWRSLTNVEKEKVMKATSKINKSLKIILNSIIILVGIVVVIGILDGKNLIMTILAIPFTFLFLLSFYVCIDFNKSAERYIEENNYFKICKTKILKKIKCSSKAAYLVTANVYLENGMQEIEIATNTNVNVGEEVYIVADFKEFNIYTKENILSTKIFKAKYIESD